MNLMDLKGFFRRLNFKNKLIFFFSLIITSSILFIGFFNYYETSAIIHKDIEKLSSKNLREVNLNLERYFSQYEQMFFVIASSPEYSNWLIAQKGDELNIGLNYMYIQNHIIVPVTLFNPEVITISMLSDNGNTNTFYLNNTLRFALNYSISEDSWVRSTRLNKTNIVSGKNRIYTMNNIVAEDLYTIRLAREFHFYANASGYIVIDVAMEPIKKILQEMKYADSGEGMLLDPAGKIMAHTDNDRITGDFDQELFTREIKDRESGYIFDKKRDRIIVFSTVEKLGWKSVAIIPHHAVFEGAGTIWSITLAVIICSITLSILLIVIVSTSLTRRIKMLGKSMKLIRTGGLGQKAVIHGNDEIRELAETYNIMLDNLEKHVHDLAESKLLQQQAVLSALQAQINSHFLYNTLEFINSMAYMAGHKEIRKAVVSLAKMLRYTSSYRETLVTVKDEVNHLEDYLNIMKMQMGGRLHFHIELEEGLEDVQCLKAVIQPIVENSIKHGLELKDTEGHIEIKAGYCGGYVFIAVYDDGRGFPGDVLEEVKKGLEITEEKNNIKDIARVGLINVNYRLKVFYNSDPRTGLSIENASEGVRTQVRLTFPMKRNGGCPDV